MNDTLTQFTNALLDAVASGGLVKLTLSKPTATAGDLKSIDIRPIMVKRALMLSFTYHHQTRDVVKNYPPQEAAALIITQIEEHFRAAYLATIAADFKLIYQDLSYKMQQLAPTKTSTSLAHDRAKTRLIDPTNKPYLHALGITDAKGAVYKNAQDKFRQIDKYIEILDGLVRMLPAQKLRVIDMGAGKGYLTFVLYDHLAHTLKREVEVIGVEFRTDLVTKCNEMVHHAGFKNLRFVEGSIADYDCTGADIVIALHACDTATDDAIAKAVKASAQLIVVAPCCHKQVRKAMGKTGAQNALAPLLEYGTYVERTAEMLTDGMRALLLEVSGYRTNLFEFISDAHTPKNVMIVATKAAKKLTEKEADLRRAEIEKIKNDFAIGYHQLERLLK